MEINANINSKFKPLFEHKRFKFIYGGRGSGKTYGIADILILIMIGFIPFGLNAKQLKNFDSDKYEVKSITILCAREIQNSIKDSVHSVLEERIKELFGNEYHKLFTITREDIRCITGGKFIFKGLYRNVTGIQSIPNIDIAWVEEAQAISSESMRILLPTVRKHGSETWFTYNPQYDNDAVNILKNNVEDKHKIEIEINWQDNPFFTEALQIQKETDYRIDYDLARHTWEGVTLKQGNDYILNYETVNQAINRQIEVNDTIEMGCDLARFGNDSTVLFKRQGYKIIDYKELTKSDAILIENEIKLMANNDKTILIKIDEGNIGGAVIDHLKKDGYNVIGVNNGGNAKNKDKYAKCITEQWFEFRNIIDKVSIPDIKRLHDELSNRKYGYTSGGKLIVEKKDDYKKRIGKSPDYADALLLCFYQVNNKKFRVTFI